MSVVGHQQFASDDISETTRPRLLLFSMKHCLVNIYQICSNGGPGVQNGPAVRSHGFENKIYLKIFISVTAWF